MSKGENNPNGKSLNLAKARRASKQRMLANRNISAREVVAKKNEKIVSVKELVIASTVKHQANLLLSDKPFNQVQNTIKVVSGIRPGKMGKHGMMTRPTRINKKKVKKMIRVNNLKQKILKSVREADVQMQ
jgi:hypothetical protein